MTVLITETTTTIKKESIETTNTCDCPPLPSVASDSVTNVYTTTQSGKGKSGKLRRNLSKSKTSSSYGYSELIISSSTNTGYYVLSEGCICPCICPVQGSTNAYVISSQSSGESGKAKKSGHRHLKSKSSSSIVYHTVSSSTANTNSCICNNSGIPANTIYRYVSTSTKSKGKSGK